MDHEYEDEEHDSIPHEIIYEILLRLPVKSLTRFRSISPLWNSTISDPSFARSHFSRSLCRRSDGSSGGATTLLLTFTHRFNAERLIFSVQIPADRDHSDAPVHQLTISGYSHPYVSQSLRGLICLNLGSICVCNPSTRKFVKLPWTGTEAMAGGSSSSPPAFALHRNNLFGFDPVGNEHKVLDTWVRFTNLDDPYKDLVMEHRVFTTGSNRWRRVEDGPPHFPLDKSVCIDGRIYYVAITSSSKNSEDVVLVAFDVARECFNFIKVPDEIGENLEISIFMEYEGHLALVDYQGLKNGNKDLAIWILEDEQEEKWVKNNIGLPVKWSEIKKNSNLDFAGTTHMGELIFAPWNMERPFYIFFFDIKKSSLRKVEISDMPEFECNALMNVRTNNHVESILPVDVA